MVWFGLEYPKGVSLDLCILLYIYINILDQVIKDALTSLSKFADDSKVGRKVKTEIEKHQKFCANPKLLHKKIIFEHVDQN